jgi:hypothetical protein
LFKEEKTRSGSIKKSIVDVFNYKKGTDTFEIGPYLDIEDKRVVPELEGFKF